MIGLFYLISVAWLVYGVYQAWAEWRLAHKGTRLPATVKGHQTDGARYYPLLGYTLDGQYREAKSTVGFAPKKRPAQGSPCEIWVLPQKPEQALMVGQSNKPAYIFSILMGLGCCAVSLWMILR